MLNKLRPSALYIATLVSVTTIVIAWILSSHDEVGTQLFTILITAGVVGLVTLAVEIVRGPSIPADTFERILESLWTEKAE